MKPRFILLLSLVLFLVVSMACQSAGPITNLFASPTPTFTITPSPTITPSLTPTPTITPSPTPLPTGVHFEKLPNNHTRITDYDSGLVLLLSKNWLSFPSDPAALKEAIQEMSEADSDLADSLRALESLGDDSLRSISLNTSRQYRDGQFLTNLIVLAIRDPMLSSFPMDLLVELNAEHVKSGPSMTKLLDSGVDRNKNNIEYGYMTVETTLNQGGARISAYQRVFIVLSGSYVSFLNVTVPSAVRDNAETLFQEVIDSIYLLENLPANSG